MAKHLVFSVTIHDCKVETFTCGGKGGAGKDTSNNGVRIIHAPSGARGEARDSRSQLQNKRAAFRRMAESEEFRRWAFKQAHREVHETHLIEVQVDKMMVESNIRVETWRGGKWVMLDAPEG